MEFLSQINLVEILSSFIVLFVIIDVTGSIPIFLSLKSSEKSIKAGQACIIALLMFVGFFYAGDLLLELFSIDVASFAVAGSFVIFILALEMVLGFDIIKYEPLIAEKFKALLRADEFVVHSEYFNVSEQLLICCFIKISISGLFTFTHSFSLSRLLEYINKTPASFFSCFNLFCLNSNVFSVARTFSK